MKGKKSNIMLKSAPLCGSVKDCRITGVKTWLRQSISNPDSGKAMRVDIRLTQPIKEAEVKDEGEEQGKVCG